MNPRKALAPWLAGIAVVVLVALDQRFSGVPLLLFTVIAAVQVGREIAVALAGRKMQPSTTVVAYTVTIVLVHVGYLRMAQGQTALLELLGTFVVALFALVLVATVAADAKLHGWPTALRDLGLAMLLGIVVSAGYSFALLLQALPRQAVTVAGSQLVAVVLAAAWLAQATARNVDKLGPAARAAGPDRRVRATLMGDLAGLVVAAVAVPAGLALVPTAQAIVPLVGGAVLGAVIGLAVAVAGHLLDGLARLVDVDSFRGPLPEQTAWLQRLYERLVQGGFPDYVGSLVVVLPAAYLALRVLYG